MVFAKKSIKKIFFNDDMTLSCAFISLFFLACVSYIYIISNGFRGIFNQTLHGLTYGDMLKKMLEFKFYVSKDVITNEAFVKDGKVYAYFSVFPAFLRLFFLPFVDVGKIYLSKLSCLIASVIFIYFNAKTILSLFAKENLEKIQKTVLIFVLINIFFTGPILYLNAISPVYHEVILWAGALSSIYFYLFLSNFFNDKKLNQKDYFYMALCAGLVLHNRVSVAIGLYVFLTFLLCLDYLKVAKQHKLIRGYNLLFLAFQKKYIIPFITLFIFGVFCLFINYKRWGNPFMFAYYDGYSFIMSDNVRNLSITKDGLFNFFRVPISFVYYFLGDSSIIDNLTRRIDVLYDGMEYPWQKGFLLMPFMMILSFVGISRLVYMSVKIKKNTEFIKIIFLSISTLITCLLMLSFMYVSLRYRLDFYGFCWITSVVGVHYLVKDIIKSTCFSKVCFVLSSVFLTFVGIYYSLQTVMLYKTIGISSNPQSWEFAKKYADLFM